MNRLLQGAMLLVAVGLILAVTGLLGLRSGNRPTLQRYKAALRANGEKLTFAELGRARVTTAVEPYAVITNALAKLDGARLRADLLEIRRYLRPGQALICWREPEPVWRASAGAVGPGTWEEVDRRMQEVRGALQEVRDTLNKPARYSGLLTNPLTGGRYNGFANILMARWLVAAMESDLRGGRLEAALQNLEALAALTHIEHERIALMSQVAGVVVAMIGLPATWEALQAPGWSDPQLERLQKAWQSMDLVSMMEEGFIGERAWGEEVFAEVRRSRGPQLRRFLQSLGFPSITRPLEELLTDYLYFPAYKLTSIDEDELLYLRHMEAGIRSLRLLRLPRPWTEAKPSLPAASGSRNQTDGGLGPWRYFGSRMFMPKCTEAAEEAVHTETERQLTLAAIALKRCKLRQGQLPLNLAALVPEYLAAVPYDYLSGGPLRYRLKADGSYALYSVGDDGKDDGGDPTPSPGTPAGLWGGRDAVWPTPTVGPAELSP